MTTLPTWLLWLGSTLLPLGACWGMWRLGLRTERCYGYNRLLLLLAPALAAWLPLLPRPPLPDWLSGSLAATPASALVAEPLPTLLVAGGHPGPAAGASWPVEGWLLGVYLLGLGLALSRLTWQWWQLHTLARRLPRQHCAGYALARTGGLLPTSSFGRTVFWNETLALAPDELAAVLAHEVAHVHQHHTLDRLWLEIWRAVLWPNPFVHLLLPALRLTHELLADREAATTVAGPGRPGYAALLARLAAGKLAVAQGSALLHPFTFSFTLTRIAMLKKQDAVRRWKQWLVLPVLGALSLAGASSVSAQEDRAQVSPVPDEATEKARVALIQRKLREAMHQDLLRTGSKIGPDTAQYFSITNMDGPGEPVVTITRVKADAAPPMPPGKKVYTYVEQMPHLPGASGGAAIVHAIQSRLVYPKVSRRERREGQVFVRFIVAADGTVHDAKLVQGLGPAYDQAVQQAVQQLPAFEPGRQNGKAVDVSFTLPVLFKRAPRR